MQKKLLLSLLATVPTALPALADIALTVPEVDGWNTTGITSTEGLTTSGTQVTCKVGVGTVYQEITKLPAGKYRISFSTLKNAVFSIEGATLEMDKVAEGETPKGGTFELKAQGAVKININAVNAAEEFGFADGMLTFVEDFSKKAAAFQAAFDKAEELVVLNAAIKTPEALVKQNKALVDQKKAITTLIAKLAQSDKTASEAISVADLIKIYDASKAKSFDELFATLNKSIADYTAAVKEYNPQFDAANKAYADQQANVAAQVRLENAIASLASDVNALIAEITAKDDKDKPLVNQKVIDANLPGVKDLNLSVEALKTAVETAFKGATTLVDTKTLDATLAELQEKYTELRAKFENDVEAIKIFEEVKKVYTSEGYNLQKDYLGANADITAIVDAKEYGNNPDVYAAKKTEWLNEIQAIYAPAKMPETFEQVDASLGVEGYKALIEEAQEKMAAVVAKAEAFAKEQNDLYVAGYNLFAAKNTGWDAKMTEYNAYVNTALPAELNTQYKALLATAQKAVDAFKSYLNATYAKTDLPGADYNAKVADVNGSFDALDNFLAGPYGKVGALIVDLNKIKASNNKALADLELSDKFTASYDAIQAAIDEILKSMTAENNYTPVASQVSDTRNAIDNLKDASDKFIKAFTSAYKTLTDSRANLAAFNKDITAKYNAATGKNYTLAEVKVYGELNKKLTDKKTGFETLYQQAADAIGQEAYDKGLALAAEMGDFAGKVASEHKAWLVTATQANLDYAKKQLADLQAFAEEHGAPKSLKFDEISAALNKITVPALGSKVEEFTKADTAVKAQMDAMAAFQANVTNYRAVMTAVGKVPAAAATATKANNDTTVGAAAKKHYEDLIAEYADTKDIVKALDKAYNTEDGVTDAVKKDLTAQAAAKEGALKALPAAIKANQDAYSNQVAESGNVRTSVQAILDNVKNAQYEGVVAGWVKQLEDLLNVRLIANDVKVGDNYAVGNSTNVDKEVMAEYKAILDAANDIAKEYKDGYDAAIIDSNNAINADFSPWAGVDNKLNNEYLAAVKLYTFYKYTITEDAGYAGWMHQEKYDLVGNYAKVYDFLPVIQKLNSDLQVLITKANEAKQYLPESDFADEYNALVADQAAQLAELTAMHTNLGNDADAAASEYYTFMVNNFESQLSAAKAQLTAPAIGFTAAEAEAGLKPVTDLLADAATLLKESKLSKGETMNSVATKFFAPINVEATTDAAIMAMWNSDYDLVVNGRSGKPATDKEPAVEAIPSISELRSSMAENGAVAEDMEKFDAVVDQITDLNTKATTIDPEVKPAPEKAPVYTELAKYVDELQALRAQLDQMAQDAADYNQYKDLWTGYQDEISEMQSLIDQLNAYIAEFTLDAPVSVADEPEALLKTLKQIVGDKPNAALATEATKTAIETQKGLIEKAVEAKYMAANKAAVATLNVWIDNTKVAYNTAIANGAKPADLQTEYDAIQTLQAEIAGITFDQGFAGDFYTVTNGYIDQLLEVYKKLNPTGSADDLAAIKAALEEEKADIAQEIEDAKAAIAEIVKTQLGEDDPDLAVLTERVQNELFPEYDALLSQLEAIQAAWEAEGDRLLVNSETYESRMDDEVQDAIEPINEKVLSTLRNIEKVYDNDMAYARLTAELDSIDTFFKEVRATIAGYGLEMQYLRQIGNIEDVIAQTKASIELAYEAVRLNEHTQLWWLNTYAGNVVYQIESMAADAALTQADYLHLDAEKAYMDAYDALVGKYLVNGVQLKIDYHNLASEYRRAMGGYWVSDDEYVNGLDQLLNMRPYYYYIKSYNAAIESMQSIIDGAAKLLEDAKDQEYTPGDVVNRDGKVTSQDVMQLVDWVGNGITYAELADNAETAWQAAAADINGDMALNIADINLDIRLALGDNYVSVSDRNLFRSAAAHVGEASFSLAYLGNVEGADRYAVVLNNPVSFIGGQFDIKLPVGLELVQVLATERTEAHDVMTFEHNAYESRVLIFSMENAAIGGSNGAVAYIDVRGNGSFSLDNVLFTDSNCELYGFDNPGTSGIIDAIIDGAGAAKEAIYDAAGRMYDRVQRGVNIIRHSDGSVTKELRK